MSTFHGSLGRRAFASAVAVLLIVGAMGPPVAARPVAFPDGSAARSQPSEATAESLLADCERLRTIAEQLAGAPTGLEFPPDLASQLATCDGLARAEPAGAQGDGSRALAPSAASSGSIAGTVTGPEGQGLPGITVYACPQGPGSCGTGSSAADGTYSIAGLVAGSYRVEFHDYGGTYASGYYSSTGLVVDYAAATPVSIPPDATGVDVELPVGLHIGGTVTGPDGKAITGFYAYACPVSGGICGYGSTPGDGTYSIGGLFPVAYRVVFYEYSGTYASGYYSSTGLVLDSASATPVTPDATGIDVELPLGLHISGTVTGPDGQGLAGVWALACPVTSGVCSSATTSGDGSYAIGRLLAGSYLVRFLDQSGAHVSGYYGSGGLTWDYYQATPVSPEAYDIDVKLSLASHITGTVTGPGGVGLEWISVSACPATGGGPCGYQTTVAQGMYSVGGLWPGSYRVWFEDRNGTYAGGYYSDSGLTRSWSAATLIEVPPDAAGIDVTLALTSHIGGTVTGPGGAPLGGMDVRAYPVGVGPFGSATTGGDGTYSIGGLGPDSYRVWFEDPNGIYLGGYYSDGGLTPSWSDATLIEVPPDAVGIDVTLPVASRISGTVTGPTGGGVGGMDGVGGIEVYAWSDESYGYATTYGDGTYSIGGLWPADYTVWFRDPSATFVNGYFATTGVTPDETAATLVEVPPDTAAIDVTLVTAGHITGTVTGASGTGLAGISVSAEPVGGGPRGWATTQGDGSYSIDGLWPGSYRILFKDWTGTYAQGYFGLDGLTPDETMATIVDVPPDVFDIDVVLPSGLQIRGTATDASGHGVAGIRVYACSVGWTCGLGATSDASGAYRVRGLAPGEYRVLFTDPTGEYVKGWYSTAGFVTRWRDATVVVVPSATSLAPVKLPAAAHISGTVLGPTGVGIRWAHVTACLMTSEWCRSDMADEAGVYSVGGLVPGSYRLLVTGPSASYASGYYTAPGITTDPTLATLVSVPPDASAVDIALPFGAAIGGTVSDAGGAGLPNVMVDACPASGGGLCGKTKTTISGRFTIRGLAPGAYLVEYQDPTGTLASGYYATSGFTPDPAAGTTVSVPPDGADIDVALPPGHRISGKVGGPRGDPASAVTVDACSVSDGWCRSASTRSDGTYAVIGLAAGDYRVSFNDPLDRYASGYYGDGGFTPNPAAATTMSVPPDTAGIDVRLPGARHISGTVTGPGGVKLPGIHVTACPTSLGEFCGSAVTGTDGTYTVGGLVRGSYEIAIEDPTDTYADGFYNETGFSVDQSTRVRVYLNDPTGVDAQTWLVPKPPARYVVTSTNNGPLAGSAVIITARLVDADGEDVPVAGMVVSWSATGAGGSFAAPTSTTDAGGVASVTFTASSTSGTIHVVTATDNAGRTGSTMIISSSPGPGPGPGPAPIGGVQGAVTVAGVDGVFAIDVAAGTEVRLSDPLGAGSSITMTFDSAAKGSIVVKPVTTLPTGVPAPPDTTVAAFSVELGGGLTTASIGRVAITFQARAELTDVTLQRYVGGTWTALPTTLVTVSGATATYRASSPGLSVFAVTATRLATPIAAGIQAGVSHRGTFSSTSVVVRSGAYVTARFRLDPALAGSLVQIRTAVRRSDGSWSAFTTVTQRKVESDGSVYYHARARGWVAMRAAFAGDETHDPGLSLSVRARGR